MLRWLALALCLLAPVPTSAETLELTVPQARGLARQAYLAGEIRLANELAHGLLAARPGDTAALLLLAATEPLLGRPRDGRKAGAEAWRSTDVRGLRHEAAFYAARAALLEERFTAAQFWLRRAYATAETEAQEQSVARDFQRLRAITPWTSALSFSVSPSSNVNGGSDSSLLLIDEFPGFGVLSGSAQALSGVTSSVEASLGYKILRRPGHETTLVFNGLQTFNELSGEAKALAPTSKGSDFNQAVAELALEHRWFDAPAPLPDSYVLNGGRRWFGGEPLDDYAGLSLQREVILRPDFGLRLGASAEQHWSLTGAADTFGLQLEAEIARQFASGSVLSFGLSTIDVRSDSINQAYTGWQADLSLSLARPVGPVALSMSLGYGEKDFPAYSIGIFAVPGGRRDDEVTAAIDLRLPDLDVLGFAPVLTVSGAWSHSNISRFEGETLGLTLGFQSVF